MSYFRPAFFLLVLGGSGLVAFQLASRPDPKSSFSAEPPSAPSNRPAAKNGPTLPANHRPLLLDEPPLQQADPTNYEVTVSDIALREIGARIERESRTRLQELTDRYQLTANQRRETFPLLVSHHPDYRGGLIVNGFTPKDPGPSDFASEFSAVLTLNQQELFQEDLGADRAWWRDVLAQIREDIDGIRRPGGEVEELDEDRFERPDLGEIFGD